MKDKNQHFHFFVENEAGYGDTLVVFDQQGGKSFYPFSPGMAKRFYAACAAMSISQELLQLEINEEDVIQDDEGCYVKTSFGYDCPSNIEKYNKDERCSVKTTYEHIYVRALYKIADELLKQQNNNE